MCLPTSPAVVQTGKRNQGSGVGLGHWKQATAELGLHLGLVPCLQHQWTQKNLGQKCQQGRGIYCLVWQTGANWVFGWVWCLRVFWRGECSLGILGVFLF